MTSENDARTAAPAGDRSRWDACGEAGCAAPGRRVRDLSRGPVHTPVDLDWVEVDRVVAVLARQIRADGLPQVVLGVPGGDELAAALVARELGVRLLRRLDPRLTGVRLVGCAGADTASTQPPVPVPRTGGVPAGAARCALGGQDVLVVDAVARQRGTAEDGVGREVRCAARLRRAVLTIDLDVAATDGPDGAGAWSGIDYLGTACRRPRFPWETA